MATQQAIETSALVDSLGVNTHIDFQAFGYQNLATTEAAINYLGLTNLRDDPENPADLGANGWWQQVAGATGAKFDAFLAEGSVAQMQGDLGRAQQLGGQGILNAIEGGNEEDDSYATSNGNSLAAAASYQPTVASAAHALGLPAINMSFGQGWTAANNYAGDYGNVGNLAGSADYANAHTYPTGAPLSSIQLLNKDANMAASGQPVMQTEFGYDTNATDPTSAAKWDLDGVMDSYAAGDARTYFYALFDDASGAFGLMNQDGSPKAPGAAIHNLTTLLSDSGGGSTPGTLDYTLSGGSGDNTLLMQKSDGSYWLSIWNDNAGAHTDTLTLGSAASQILVFDPLTGTSAVQTSSDTATAQIQVPDHPVLVEVINPGGAAGAGTTQAAATGPTPATTPATAPTTTQAAGSATTTPATTPAAPGTQPSAGAGDQMSFITGSGQIIDAGPGAHALQENGSDNTIVLPAAGQGNDTITGNVLGNGDQFDLRGLLAATSWTGDPSTIGDFVKVGSDASGDGVISVNPTGAAGGTSTAVATLVGSGAVRLSTLLSHSITQ